MYTEVCRHRLNGPADGLSSPNLLPGRLNTAEATPQRAERACEITIILFLLEAALLSELGGMNYSALARVGASLSPLYPLSPCPPTLLPDSLDVTWGCHSTTQRQRRGTPQPHPYPRPHASVHNLSPSSPVSNNFLGR